MSSTNAPARPPLPLGKKIAFASVAFVLALGPAALLSEAAYRWAFDIPFVGGVLAGDGRGRLADNPRNRSISQLHQASDNPILGYELRPGGKLGIYEHSAQGLRDRIYDEKKPAGTFRIAVLGDSIIWGHGVKLEDTFAKQLEQKLNERSSGTRFEVMSFGVSGYSTEQEVELYRVKAKRFDPDLVIVGYCLNDWTSSSVEGDAFRRLYYQLWEHSYLLEHIQRGLSAWNVTGGDDGERAIDLRAHFKKLQDLQEGRTTLLVIFPGLVDFESYLFVGEHERARAAVKGLAYEVLDLLEVYRGQDPDELVTQPRDRTHPNRKGFDLATDAVLKVLDEKALLPP